LVFELEQQGPTVKGVMRLTAGTSQMGSQGAKSGPIEGTVAGDVFRFSQTNGSVEGQVTISGDEMNGRASFGSTSRPLFLRTRRSTLSASLAAPMRPGQLGEGRSLGEDEAQAAGSAAEVEQPVRRRGPGVRDERRCQPATPPAHQSGS